MTTINSFSPSSSYFHKTLLKWFDAHGRKNLPWQQNKTPYRVWVSEIMLQQTQVSTVILYFLRFMEKFPDIATLASASEDTVLHFWSGLGYYQRARLLHKTAKTLTTESNGHFPSELVELEKLPGIGRSTAGAILSLAFEKPAPILDGNVKRVLTRLQGITTWPGEKVTIDLLWKIAEYYTPQQRCADYTQAIMDLGATVCTRAKPQCQRCPFASVCVANNLKITNTIPIAKPRKTLPIRYVTFLALQKNDSILLQKRSPQGVWANLWSLPEINEHVSEKIIKQFCKQHLKVSARKLQYLAPIKHSFSHYHLEILPVTIEITETKPKIMESSQQIWYNLKHAQSVGIPAPVKLLLDRLL